jgi:hypothetical protein
MHLHQHISMIHKMTEEVVRIVRELGPDGNLVNVEQRVRIHRTEIRKPRVVVERRKWAKFGAAAGTAPGPEPGITIIRCAARLLANVFFTMIDCFNE